MFRLNLDSYASVVVNGVSVGSNTKDVIKIDNGKVTINDIPVDGIVDFELTIKTNKDNVKLRTNNFNVTLYGNVGTVNTAGDVEVTGNVANNINTAGDVSVAGYVGGNVNTAGDVTCGKVSGRVSTSGDVTIN